MNKLICYTCENICQANIDVQFILDPNVIAIYCYLN
jgi:hypothetical protein